MTATSVTGRAVIRPLGPADARFAARLHAAALPHGFFVRLGPAFLAAYYRSFVVSPHAVARLALVDGRPAGVLVGLLHHRAHQQWVLRVRGWRLAAAGALAMLVRPRVAWDFLRARLGRYARVARRFVTARGDQEPGATRQVAVLSHVSVVPARRGQGVGSALVEEFLSAATRDGASEAMLVTLAGADGAGAFYAGGGWHHREDHTDVEGRRVSVYARSLT